MAGWGVVLKEIIEQLEFLYLFNLLTKSVDAFDRKVFMHGNQSVLNRFSNSGLNPPRPGY